MALFFQYSHRIWCGWRLSHTMKRYRLKSLRLGIYPLFAVSMSLIAPASMFLVAKACASQEDLNKKQDLTSSIKARLERGEAVFLENNRQPYHLTSTLKFGAGASLRGSVGTVLAFSNESPAFDIPVGSNDVVIENIVFRQNGKSKILGAVRAENFRLLGGGGESCRNPRFFRRSQRASRKRTIFGRRCSECNCHYKQLVRNRRGWK